MRIERIYLKNFRTLQEVTLKNIPPLAVFTGENGSGKSTIFQAFSFLKNALQHNINIALQRMGGYKEVVTRGHVNEPIVIEIKLRMVIAEVNRLVTYSLEVAEEEEGKPFIRREFLRYKRGQYGSPFHFLDFRNGEGFAISNEEDFNKPDEDLTKEHQRLDSPNVLAIKGLGQFQRFKAANIFRSLIENWHVSDFHIMAARKQAEVGFAEHLSESGDNLPLVVQHLYKNNLQVFNEVLEKFKEKIKGMSDVTPSVTEDGRVLLRFKDGIFEDPFLARHVSDGTIKMFAYMVLLCDPKPHPFLCIEEPENQLYPTLLTDLLDELRDYANRGGQVFVSTHSPDMLNQTAIDEVFFLKKQEGVTGIHKVADNEQLVSLVDAGDQLGWLWQEGLLERCIGKK